MQEEHYIKILDELTEWKIGVHLSSGSGRPKTKIKNEEDSDPINGHPVVLSYKTIAQPCDWCEGTCSKEKTYRRSLGSNLWTGKCQDCGEKRHILTSDINITK